MSQKTGCFFCGKELIYHNTNESMVCLYCNNTFSTNAICIDGHYICDTCHSAGANDIIESHCLNSESTDPIHIALTLMKHPTVKMHGPEHHFLIPAVLLTTYYNLEKKQSEKEEKLKQARKRAETVPGNSCGFHGNCGAAVGTGIFISLVTDATPLSKNAWQEANMITAKSLLAIATHGGPRCCKRNTLLAISTIAAHLKWKLPKTLHCDFHHLNKECLKNNCLYYPFT